MCTRPPQTTRAPTLRIKRFFIARGVTKGEGGPRGGSLHTSDSKCTGRDQLSGQFELDLLRAGWKVRVGHSFSDDRFLFQAICSQTTSSPLPSLPVRAHGWRSLKQKGGEVSPRAQDAAGGEGHSSCRASGVGCAAASSCCQGWCPSCCHPTGAAACARASVRRAGSQPLQAVWQDTHLPGVLAGCVWAA